jgi:nucleolar protein 4
MSTLYVGGLPPSADTEFLRDLFEGFASVEAIRLIRHDPEGPHRGFGYVTFADADEAAEAAESLDGESGLRIAPAR